MQPAAKVSVGAHVSLLCLTVLMFFVGCGRNSSATQVQSDSNSEAKSLASDGVNGETEQDRLAWNLWTLGEAYETVGKKKVKWNASARRALDEFAHLRSSKGPPEQIRLQLIATNCAAAVASGCDDPLIMYLHTRYVLAKRNVTAADLAKALRKAAESLGNSEYPPIRKFYATLRAAEQLKSIAGTNTPPEVHEFRRLAVDNLALSLRDKSMPVGEVDDACHSMLNALKVNKDYYEDCYRNIEGSLFANWPNEAVSFLLKGEFYLADAWFGRGGGYASGVSEQGWQLFAERLAVSETALERAWQLDPKDTRIPTTMIRVEEGQGKGRERMELWFERAMALDPNNRTACENKLHYLYPQWYGSRKEMIAFGRECVASAAWGGTVPLMLTDAHREYELYLDNAEERETYWKRPDVWPDIKASFEKFFQLNPNAVGWYHNNAWYAYHCEQWETLNELIPKLAPVDYSFFGGRDEFDKMVRLAKENGNRFKLEQGK